MPHTPGPWRVNSKFEIVPAIIEDTEIPVIAELPANSSLPGGEKVANLHLIAAAPQLLAMCKKLKLYVGIVGHFNELEYIIKKAEGRL